MQITGINTRVGRRLIVTGSFRNETSPVGLYFNFTLMFTTSSKSGLWSLDLLADLQTLAYDNIPRQTGFIIHVLYFERILTESLFGVVAIAFATVSLNFAPILITRTLFEAFFKTFIYFHMFVFACELQRFISYGVKLLYLVQKFLLKKYGKPAFALLYASRVK